jgi:hypothetical protein
MALSDAIALIQIAVAIGAFLFAYREFKQWRFELLGSKKIEAGLRLGKLAREIKQAFITARWPVGYALKAPEYRPDSTPAEKERQDKAYTFEQRIQPLREKLRQLNEFSWEIAVLFGENDSIDGQVRAYNDKFAEFCAAIETTLDGERTVKETKIMYGDGNDEFSKAIEQITDELLVFARKHVR